MVSRIASVTSRTSSSPWKRSMICELVGPDPCRLIAELQDGPQSFSHPDEHLVADRPDPGCR
ncbi:MAG: hypothetical protein R2789_04655 [Microthrixaceae bacterium]